MFLLLTLLFNIFSVQLVMLNAQKAKPESLIQFDEKISQLTDGQKSRIIDKAIESRKQVKSASTETKIKDFQAITTSIRNRFENKKQALTDNEKDEIKVQLKEKRKLFKEINELLKVDTEEKVKKSLKRSEAALIQSIEPVVWYESQDVFNPNDPSFVDQWGLQSIQLVGLGTSNTSSDKVLIAVIDSGVDFSHEELGANKWTPSICVDENNVAISGGCPNGGWDFIDSDNDPFPVDNIAHGTQVAGVIAAETDNNIGIASAGNNQLKVMSLRACCNADGFFESDAIADAIYFAVNNGAQIINASFGGPTPSVELESALQYAQANDVLVVSAAGNYATDNDTEPFYPANYNQTYNHIISVGSLNPWNGLAWFSNFGDQTVDILAPGQDIRLLNLNNGYTNQHGTSFSTPFVSSILGRLTQRTDLTDSQLVKDELFNTIMQLQALDYLVQLGNILRFELPYVCGNGVVEDLEECDDGNLVDGDGCSSLCTTEQAPSQPECGNGTVETGEECDDGNTTDGDGCSALCETEETTSTPECGNNIIEEGEVCDDGNIVDNDGCSAICQTETTTPPIAECGNGTVEYGEECDDGNLSNGDGCSAVCTEETLPGVGTTGSIIPIASASTGTMIFHHEDHLTGANVDTDESGNIISLVDYYPFGDTRLDEHSQDYENDYKFTGKEKDEDTGLYYYEARYYDSSIGRFVSRDTWEGDLGNPQTLNKYAYTLNNPVKYVDKNGNFAITATSLSIVGIAALATALVTYKTIDTVNTVGEIRERWKESGYQKDPSGIVHTGHNTPLNGNQGLVETYPSSFKGFELTGIDVLQKDKGDNITSFPGSSGLEKKPYMEGKSIPQSLPLFGNANRTGLIWDGNSIKQGRTWDQTGNPLVDFDFTDHGTPEVHSNPHHHIWTPNAEGKYDASSRSAPIDGMPQKEESDEIDID